MHFRLREVHHQQLIPVHGDLHLLWSVSASTSEAVDRLVPTTAKKRVAPTSHSTGIRPMAVSTITATPGPVPSSRAPCLSSPRRPWPCLCPTPRSASSTRP